jgi:formylglycine-generating enzyme required for sulfatase activity
MVAKRYTQTPRTTLWLLRGDIFRMGGLGAEPRFEAEVAPFYISKSPITNQQYEAFAPTHGRGPTSQADDDPVVNVSWNEAAAYCRWYSALSRKSFRLPTEVEWEYACRGDHEGHYFWGDSVEAAEPYVWDAQNSDGRVHAIETRKANGHGLYDMLGNIWEWTTSLHQPYPATDDDGRDDLSATGPRVIRGGSFRTDRAEMGCHIRFAADPDDRRDDTGFRIMRLLH